MSEINISKEEFNNLDINKQVEFINDELKFKSLTKICDSIEINRATIRKRFKREGYLLNKNLLIYEKVEGQTNTNNHLDKPVDTLSNNIDINVLAKDLSALKKQIQGLNEDIINISKINNTINTTNTDIKPIIQIFDKEIVSRSYKLDKDVQQKFKAYCKKYSEHRVSDILSTILKEYLDTHS